ncbi:hypothetical protein N657DRAFT_639326 [Parathielavia appendiculata]|uniref:Uncharacterized protein n=1 Tax=Parathielavia appendiculata TaxID=2587402 RepID=A0AAN6U9F9_9PEZI|nr:hypothetical protein N657DRAFT_639326 [Parathielavia appendiculata]
MPSSDIASPDIAAIIAPVLSALPGAAVSTEPATTVLPFLTPILRQRVQVFSSPSQEPSGSSQGSEPWIRLLTYDAVKVAQLTKVAQSGSLDPHPVSGEIEVDWDCDIGVRYKRLDEETLQALVVLKELGLFFRLEYCMHDSIDGGAGWRVGEIRVADSSFLISFGGFPDIRQAEKEFQAAKAAVNSRPIVNGSLAANSSQGSWSAQDPADDEDDDDDYWARYDATPSRTPAAKHSPAPRAPTQAYGSSIQRSQSAEAEDAYFAQYDSVQPAMDNHDPDEQAVLDEHVESLPSLGLAKPQPAQGNGTSTTITTTNQKNTTSNDGPALAQPIPIKPNSVRSSASHGSGSGSSSQEESWVMAQPRPGSSASASSSNGSQTVARLEGAAETRQQAEFGVRQHIARSIRSLFLLSRASGIDRDEFERMVRMELDVLGMVEDSI